MDCANSMTGHVCSLDMGCVQCNDDPDCPQATHFCNDHTCQQCRRDRDCPMTAPNCNNGTCGM
jgi:hypothetical protein